MSDLTERKGSPAPHLGILVGPETVGQLIERGSAVNPRGRDGRTPMFLAAEAGHTLAADTLKKRGGVIRPKRFLFFDLK